MNLKKIFTELTTVILGILIALFINGWKEDRDNQKFIQEALNTIEKEMAESNVAIEEILPRHYALADSINTYISDPSISIREIAEKSGGMQYPFVKNIGLRFFVSSKAELINYETISQLTEIEDSKALMDKKFDKLMDFAYDNMENTDQKSKTLFIIHLSNVVDSEMQMQELFKNYLNKEKENE